MGVGFSSSSCSLSLSSPTPFLSTTLSPRKSKTIYTIYKNHFLFPQTLHKKPFKMSVNCAKDGEIAIKDLHKMNPELIEKMVYDALVWSSLHGLVVGDRNVQRSSTVPGVGMVHAPFALLPMSFPENKYIQACELAPIFNELVDRVSLDAKFLQDSLSRTKKVDSFTSRLLDIHSNMLASDKKEEIRLGLHRSDYMLDEQTKLLLQIELNTISSSFPGLSCLVTNLHRSLLDDYKDLGLDSSKVPGNNAVNGFAEALAKAWKEYNNPRAVIMFVVQPEERNMYDQHWLSATLKEKYPFFSRIKHLTQELCSWH